MEYIDVHTHLNLTAFSDDADEVTLRALEEEVYFINVGTQYETSKQAVSCLEKYPIGVYATVGLHPTSVNGGHVNSMERMKEEHARGYRGEVFDDARYEKFLQNERVVAIGECGLDYYRNPSEEEKRRQVEAFEAQIALANKVDKPLMLHIRNGEGGNAYKEAFNILKKQARVVGNSHFFAGTLEDAAHFWNLGYATSFTGVLTFTDAYDELVKQAPCELLHAETDAPYVTPVPYRGKRNEPIFVREVVERMAQIRGVDVEILKDILRTNAKKLFGVG